MTTEQQFDTIDKKLNHIQVMEAVKLAVIVLGFLGVMSVISKEIKKAMK